MAEPRPIEQIFETMTRLSEVLNTSIVSVFGEVGLPEDVSFVMGVQFAGHGGCEVISNINTCGLPQALDDMLHEAMRLHRESHSEGHEVTEVVVPEESVPEDVRETAEGMAAAFGAQKIIYTETVDTSDLEESDGSEFIDDVTPEDGGS